MTVDTDEIQVLQEVSQSYKSNSDQSQDITDLKKENVRKWKLFNDNQVVPLRIEQNIMYATLLNEQQDLFAKNTTITENQSVQLGMVDRILSDFHNKGYGSMREFQSLDYNLNLKNLQITIVKYTTLLASICFLMIGLTMMGIFDQNVSAMVISVLIILYIVVIFMQYKQNQIRRKYDWNKMYWKSPIKPKKNADSCKFLGLF